MAGDIPVVRWVLPDSFKNQPEHIRKAETLAFCEARLAPILEKLDPERPHYYGQDFARSGDASAIMAGAEERSLVRVVKLVVELRNVPFETQRDVLFYIVDRLPRFSGGANDATGNGAYLAEVARQKYGERFVEVKATAEWYRVNSPPYVEAFGDNTIVLPRDQDVIRDHQALVYVNGVIKVPDDMRFKGEDGLERHGDTAIAGLMFWHATQQGAVEYGYETASPGSPGTRDRSFHRPPTEREDNSRPWYRPPLGSRLRGWL